MIKVEVKYDHSFDANFDARQMCVKSVIALPIHLILDKQDGKCDLNFDSTFDARQRRNQICYGFATTFESCQRRGQTCQLLWLQFWRASKAFKDTTALHTFDLLCQRRSKTSRLCIPLISYVKGVQRRHGFVQLWSYVMSGQRRVKDGHILRLLFKRPNYVIFSVFTIKWSLLSCQSEFFLIKKVFIWPGGGPRKQRENAAASGFPHFSGQSEMTP